MSTRPRPTFTTYDGRSRRDDTMPRMPADARGKLGTARPRELGHLVDARLDPFAAIAGLHRLCDPQGRQLGRHADHPGELAREHVQWALGRQLRVIDDQIGRQPT
jgi:hypothetical protein